MTTPAPKPHDPQAPRVEPAQLQTAVEEVLSARPEELPEELAVLERAHNLLHEALQK